VALALCPTTAFPFPPTVPRYLLFCAFPPAGVHVAGIHQNAVLTLRTIFVRATQAVRLVLFWASLCLSVLCSRRGWRQGGRARCLPTIQCKGVAFLSAFLLPAGAGGRRLLPAAGGSAAPILHDGHPATTAPVLASWFLCRGLEKSQISAADASPLLPSVAWLLWHPTLRALYHYYTPSICICCLRRRHARTYGTDGGVWKRGGTVLPFTYFAY